VDLAGAGCPLIEIDEPEAFAIAADDSERRLFIEAHRRLTAGLSSTHLSLAITGGNADAAGVETFLDAPYASYAFDLINGPDNWRLVTAIPGDRGIVCGALDSRARSDDAVELVVWAAQYAASTSGRGLDRVGLAVVPGLADQEWPIVERKLGVLGRAVRVAGLTGDDLASSIDPRAVDIRSAALGKYQPPRDRPRRRR
jgi:methionine synthase II (cobalamin-independent)